MESTLLYCDLYKGEVSNTASGGAYSFPTITAGGNLVYGLRFLEYYGSYQQVYPAIAAVRMAMGFKDQRPKSGSYHLKASVGASTAANTTAALNFDATSSAVQTALNALSIATGNPFVVTDVTGGYIVRRTNGATIDLSVIGNSLLPISFGTVESEEFSGVWQYEVRLRQAPLAYTDTGVVVPPPEPVIAEVQAGGTSPDGITKWNEIQSLTLSPNFQGTYQLQRGYEKTILLDITDGASQLQDALNTILASEGGSVVVTNPSSNVAHIEFQGSLSGSAQDLLVVHVYSAPPGDLTFKLNLGTVEMLTALRDAAGKSLSVPFEAEADFYIDPRDHSAGTIPRKLWSTNVTIQPPLIFPDLAAISTIDWIRPPSNTYIPYTPDQIITGTQYYTQVIGDGTTTVFHLTHNLGTNNLASVIVRENVASGTLLRLGVDYLLSFDSENALTISFPSAPAASALAVVIAAAGPTSAFQAHTHTIEQIVGLQTLLDSFGSRLAYLMSMVPNPTSFAPSSGLKDAVTTSPPIGELLPDLNLLDSVLSLTSQVATSDPTKAPAIIPGTTLDDQKQKDDANLKKIVADKTAAATTVPEPIQTLSFTVAPEVIGWRGAMPTIGSNGFSDSQFVGFAPAFPSASNSIPPANFARELWRIALNSNLLSPGREVQTDWGVALQLLKANCLAEYKMVLEVGTYDDPESILGVTWNQAPVFSQPIAITKELATHSFGANIKNESGIITLAHQIYGTSGAEKISLSSANIVVRCRLINLEADPYTADVPRGYVYYSLVPSTTAAAGISIPGAQILQSN